MSCQTENFIFFFGGVGTKCLFKDLCFRSGDGDVVAPIRGGRYDSRQRHLPLRQYCYGILAPERNACINAPYTAHAMLFPSLQKQNAKNIDFKRTISSAAVDASSRYAISS